MNSLPAVPGQVQLATAPLTYSEVDQLMAHLISNKRVVAHAVRNLKPDMFGAGEDPHRAVWTIVSEYFLVNNELPAMETVMVKLDGQVQQDPDLKAHLPYLEDKLGIWQDLALGQDVPAATETLQRFLKQRYIAVEAMSTDLTDPQALMQLAQKASSVMSKRHGPENVFEIRKLDYTPPNPGRKTGQMVFDRLTDKGPNDRGGIRRNNTVVVLGSSGAGKTTLGLDISANCARQHLPGMYFAWEKRAKEEVTPKLWANLSGVDCNMLTAKWHEDLPQDVRDKLYALEWAKPFISVHDMCHPGTGERGTLDVIDAVEQYIEDHGEPPLWIVIDWLGTMVKKRMGVQGIDTSKVTSEMDMEAQMLHHNVAQRYPVQLILLHQTKSESNSIDFRPDQFDSQNCRSLCNLADSMIILAPIDKTAEKRGLAYNGKNRGTSDSFMTMRVGELAQIFPEDGSFQSVTGPDGAKYWEKM